MIKAEKVVTVKYNLSAITMPEAFGLMVMWSEEGQNRKIIFECINSLLRGWTGRIDKGAWICSANDNNAEVQFIPGKGFVNIKVFAGTDNVVVLDEQIDYDWLEDFDMLEE